MISVRHLELAASSLTALLQLSDDVVKDLSNDKAYGYRITQAIKTGELPTDLVLLKIGPLSHSHWLTTANRFCRIYVSKHGLSGKTLINLRLIVEYIVGVYYPCWFNIKDQTLLSGRSTPRVVSAAATEASRQ